MGSGCHDNDIVEGGTNLLMILTESKWHQSQLWYQGLRWIGIQFLSCTWLTYSKSTRKKQTTKKKNTLELYKSDYVRLKLLGHLHSSAILFLALNGMSCLSEITTWFPLTVCHCNHLFSSLAWHCSCIFLRGHTNGKHQFACWGSSQVWSWQCDDELLG